MTADFTAHIQLKENVLEDVIGITKLRNKIYVIGRIRAKNKTHVTGKSYNAICVFDDSHPFYLRDEIKLEDDECLIDIASCENYNCLYVLPLSSKCVWKMKPIEEMEHTINREWLTFLPQDFRPKLLSMSSDENLLILSRHSHMILRMYASDTKLLLSIQLFLDLQMPCGLVRSANGNFLILHALQKANATEIEARQKKDDEQLMWTVSEVSRDGKTVIHRFNPAVPEHALNESLDRCDICIDSEDRVFVADTLNNRVILLDSSLQWDGVIIPAHKVADNKPMLNWSKRFFYDEAKEQLIIEDKTGIRIYILKRQYFFV